MQTSSRHQSDISAEKLIKVIEDRINTINDDIVYRYAKKGWFGKLFKNIVTVRKLDENSLRYGKEKGLHYYAGKSTSKLGKEYSHIFHLSVAQKSSFHREIKNSLVLVEKKDELYHYFQLCSASLSHYWVAYALAKERKLFEAMKFMEIGAYLIGCSGLYILYQEDDSNLGRKSKKRTQKQKLNSERSKMALSEKIGLYMLFNNGKPMQDENNIVHFEEWKNKEDCITYALNNGIVNYSNITRTLSSMLKEREKNEKIYDDNMSLLADMLTNDKLDYEEKIKNIYRSKDYDPHDRKTQIRLDRLDNLSFSFNREVSEIFEQAEEALQALNRENMISSKDDVPALDGLHPYPYLWTENQDKTVHPSKFSFNNNDGIWDTIQKLAKDRGKSIEMSPAEERLNILFEIKKSIKNKASYNEIIKSMDKDMSKKYTTDDLIKLKRTFHRDGINGVINLSD